MNAVVDTPQLRAQYNDNLPRLTAFWTELSQNEALYARFKALAAAPDFAQWPAARRRIVENELRDFRLGGAELDGAHKRGSANCASGSRSSRRVSPRTSSMRPTPLRCISPTAMRWPGCRTIRCGRSVKRRRPTGRPATRSHCSIRATRPFSTTPMTGRCANSFIAPTSRAPRSTAIRTGTTVR